MGKEKKKENGQSLFLAIPSSAWERHYARIYTLRGHTGTGSWAELIHTHLPQKLPRSFIPHYAHFQVFQQYFHRPCTKSLSKVCYKHPLLCSASLERSKIKTPRLVPGTPLRLAKSRVVWMRWDPPHPWCVTLFSLPPCSGEMGEQGKEGWRGERSPGTQQGGQEGACGLPFGSPSLYHGALSQAEVRQMWSHSGFITFWEQVFKNKPEKKEQKLAELV